MKAFISQVTDALTLQNEDLQCANLDGGIAMEERNYQEIVVRFPLQDGETMAPKGSVMSLDDGLARAFRTIVDYGEVVEPDQHPAEPGGGLSIDSPNLKTMTIAYDAEEGLVPANSLVIVNKPADRILTSLLKASTVIPGKMPNVLNDHDQTRRLTIGEGIQDPLAGRVFDRMYAALASQDYQVLEEVYAPDIELISVVDETGASVVISGRDNVIRNQQTRWDYWVDMYGPVKHEFDSVFISTNSAQIRFRIKNTKLKFGSMYTLSNHQITSIRHMKEDSFSDCFSPRSKASILNTG